VTRSLGIIAKLSYISNENIKCTAVIICYTDSQLVYVRGRGENSVSAVTPMIGRLSTPRMCTEAIIGLVFRVYDLILD
jgi:hypothetical protein